MKINDCDTPLELAGVIAEELQTILNIADGMEEHMNTFKTFNCNSRFYDSAANDLKTVAHELRNAASYLAFAINGLVNMACDDAEEEEDDT